MLIALNLTNDQKLIDTNGGGECGKLVLPKKWLPGTVGVHIKL